MHTHHSITKILAALFLFVAMCGAQQPQTSDVSSTQPIYAVNSKWVQGLGPGYWPTKATGLVLNIAAGTSFCSGTIASYAGGTLTLTDNATNYVYLNTASSCAPAAKTSAFIGTDIPLALVTTLSGAITAIVDDRTWFVTPAYTLKVNAATLAAGDTVTFSNSTPAAGANGRNITFQTSHSSGADSISGEIVGDGDATHFFDGTGAYSTPPFSGSSQQYIYVPNCGSTGTTNNKVAKWGSFPVNDSCAVIATTSDTNVGAPIIGVVVSGGGTTGKAKIAIGGFANCQFDSANAVAQGHSVELSFLVNGDCSDMGVAPANENPEGHFIFGIADASGSAGTVLGVDLTPIVPGFGNIASHPVTPTGMTILAGSAYGAAFAMPSVFQQTGPTNQAGVEGALGVGFRFYYSGSHYTRLYQGGGASTHDFNLDVLTNSFDAWDMLRINAAAYSVPWTSTSVSGTWSVGQVGHFKPTSNVLVAKLTGNTTIPTPEVDNAGLILHFRVCQDSTGGWSLTWPANFINAGTMPSAANACMTQSFVNDGTSYYALAPPGSSSGGGGSGTVTSVATSSPIAGGTITTSGTVSCPTCAIGPGSSTAHHIAKFSGTDGVTLEDGGAATSGTVTSVATSFADHRRDDHRNRNDRTRDVGRLGRQLHEFKHYGRRLRSRNRGEQRVGRDYLAFFSVHLFAVHLCLGNQFQQHRVDYESFDHDRRRRPTFRRLSRRIESRQHHRNQLAVGHVYATELREQREHVFARVLHRERRRRRHNVDLYAVELGTFSVDDRSRLHEKRQRDGRTRE
jgi:hypothetical protein